MKLSILRRWRLMSAFERDGARARDSAHPDESTGERAYLREIARMDEALRFEARSMSVHAPTRLRQRVMATLPDRAQNLDREPAHTRLHVVAAAVSILFAVGLTLLWKYSDRRSPTTGSEISSTDRPGTTRNATSANTGATAGDADGHALRSRVAALDRVFEERLRTEVRSMRRDARAMAANTASWLPKPWFALLTDESATSR